MILMAIGTLAGCRTLVESTTDSFLHRKENRYVLEKKNEILLDGPYKIMMRTTADSMIVEKDRIQYVLNLRGIKSFGVLFENRVKHSYILDLGLYLLKDTVINVSSNEIKAVVYQPANQVYVGGSKGFENLTYVMPQLLHIAYGELGVDHSDTNYPLYEVFRDAENVAKKNRMGYWATHPEPPGERDGKDAN